MSRRLVKSVRVAGFLSIREAMVELRPLNLLVGANGAGKSNFIKAVEMLGRIGRKDLGLHVGRAGGASNLLGDGSRQILLAMDAEDAGYTAIFEPAADDSLIFNREVVVGAGILASGHAESRLRSQVAEEKAVLDHLAGFRAYHFRNTSADAPVRVNTDLADNVALREDGGNLAAVLHRFRSSDPTVYARIVRVIRLAAPFFRDFVLEPEANPDRLRLRWRQVGSDRVFGANQMSDGTLRFVCQATLLLQPELPGLIALDEPELGLHPFAIAQLASMLQQVSVRAQVLVATQSVTLMNQFGIEDLIVVDRRDGASMFARPDQERLRAWLEDYSLGELWEKNILGGRPTHEDE